ncbi:MULTISPECIES: sterol desaturase family protein [unclassified Sphingopyxis]|uniref:sterol desaturase family protein n=1 Tax=unclassified Sphingopyxis TaxID=2614943 RepID=UPI00285D5708|nr:MULTISPECIES: sterol desaturase family protein [unclassified Sphingopyxis]MDR6832760.1 sterol desaturase/sphingolipid hydroxylase (fatty acid hydroxylase superfamily) [Sphingopyxis sp. BE122]MDR7228503.1 sterol desaturase/sphingolipid hydroxylase (fatty acid hydroxylase superfamily) [Sphingopyxis sp. BE259]
MDTLLKLVDLQSAWLIALIFLPLERLLPARPNQGPLRRGWFNDTVFFILNRIPIGIGLLVVAAGSIAVGQAVLPTEFRASVAQQPLWLQVVALMLVADLCFYAMHRLFHTLPTLWRFHAIHHSIEELDWLAAHRVHPVDQILTKGASIAPVFALGFADGAIAIFFLLYQWHSLMLHANLRIGFGPLHWVFASPCFHHWHHADHPEAWNRNFSAQFPIWDVIFGTAHMRRDAMPTRYGIDDDVPATYARQLLYPFRRDQDDIGAAPSAHTDGTAVAGQG